MRGSYINFQATESSREELEEVAELAGARHPYRFELEDTSSADHSEYSNEENELQEDRLMDILLGDCIV